MNLPVLNIPALNIPVLVQTFVVVFVLADAVGNAPLFLILTKGMEAGHRGRVVDRATIVATAVLISFALGGQLILNYLHISIASMEVAGGLLLLLIALDMLRGEMDNPIVEEGRDIAITPLALPLLAGPGTLTTVMVLVSDSPDARWSVVLGIVGAMIATWIIMRQSSIVDRWLGAEGSIIAMKLLGFLLAALAVEIGIGGLRELLLIPTT